MVFFSAGNAPDTNAILGEGSSCFRAPRLCLCLSVLLCSTAVYSCSSVLLPPRLCMHFSVFLCYTAMFATPACSCAPFPRIPGVKDLLIGLKRCYICCKGGCYCCSAVVCMTWSQHSHLVTPQHQIAQDGSAPAGRQVLESQARRHNAINTLSLFPAGISCWTRTLASPWSVNYCCDNQVQCQAEWSQVPHTGTASPRAHSVIPVPMVPVTVGYKPYAANAPLCPCRLQAPAGTPQRQRRDAHRAIGMPSSLGEAARPRRRQRAWQRRGCPWAQGQVPGGAARLSAAARSSSGRPRPWSASASSVRSALCASAADSCHMVTWHATRRPQKFLCLPPSLHLATSLQAPPLLETRQAASGVHAAPLSRAPGATAATPSRGCLARTVCRRCLCAACGKPGRGRCTVPAGAPLRWPSATRGTARPAVRPARCPAPAQA